MQQPATAEASPNFAGVLASFTAPGQKRPPARDLDGLEEDVVALSYERALRTHSRFRPTSIDPPPAPVPRTDRLSIVEVFPFGLEPEAVTPLEARAKSENMPGAGPDLGPVPATAPPSDNSKPLDRNLKCASITIRLSNAECAQVRQRAAEAGLTISAYLRSCTVEAESLRAQVMGTLAQMRAEKSKENELEPTDAGRRWFDWLRRFRPQTGQSAAPA